MLSHQYPHLSNGLAVISILSVLPINAYVRSVGWKERIEWVVLLKAFNTVMIGIKAHQDQFGYMKMGIRNRKEVKLY